MNGKYHIDRDLFFDLNDDHLWEYEKNIQKKVQLDFRNFVFSNRMINNWNSLPQCSIYY